MKHLILVVSSLLISGFSFGLCNDNDETYYRGNTGTIDVKSITDNLSSSSGNCGMTFDNDFSSSTLSLKIGGYHIPTVLVQPYYDETNGSFDVDGLREALYSNFTPLSNWIYYTGSQTVSEFVGNNAVWHLEVKVTLSNFWNQLGKVYKQIHLIQNPSMVTLEKYLCSDVKYALEDLATNVSSSYVNQNLSFQNGETFINDSVTLSQTVNNSVHYTFLATINGYACKRDVYASINVREQAYFTSVAQAGGPITSLSPSIQLSTLSYVSGGNVEYFGSGIINNGGTWYFDPSTSNLENVIVYIRTDNAGCKSEWRDTLFYVTPIVTGFSAPTLNLPATFGPGEYGNFLVVNTTGSNVINGRFHYGCSNRNYTFHVSSPTSGLTYEWKTVFQNYIHSSGTGTSFTVNTPDRTVVGINSSSSLYSSEDHYNNLNLYHNGLMYFGSDLDNSGGVDPDESLYSTFLGDQMRVLVRAVDVFNNASDWTVFTLGIVPSVELQDQSILCYTGNPILSPVTTTPIYYDSIQYDDQRSVRWDVNNDGIFELDGSVDNVLQFMTNTNKLNFMQSQIIDSIKCNAWNPDTDQFFTVWNDQMSEVCFSTIDTVSVIRKPIINVSFSDVDTLQYGSAVLSVVNGTYFNASSDSITWNWNDGSQTYFSDSVWHYLNDLGDYSLYLTVYDHLGCSTDTSFLDFWHVPGVLNVNEVELNVGLYPVPVRDILNIQSKKIISEVEILNQLGMVVYKGNENAIDMSSCPSGVYVVKIIIEGEVLNKSVIKL